MMAVAPGFICFPMIAAMTGDRFVLRDWSESKTLAGGVVLAMPSDRRRFRSPRHLDLLRTRAADPRSPASHIASAIRRDLAPKRTDVRAAGPFSDRAAETAVAELIDAGTILAAGDRLIARAWWDALVEDGKAGLERYHKAHPHSGGMPLNEFKAQWKNRLPEPDLMNAWLDALRRAGTVASGNLVRLATHRPQLPPELQAAGDALRKALSDKPFEPPPLKTLLTGEADRQAFRFLIDSGEILRISDDLALASWAMTRIKRVIKTHIQENGPATVSALRERLGTSRRVLVPLLEALDRSGFTRRAGDKRVLA